MTNFEKELLLELRNVVLKAKCIVDACVDRYPSDDVRDAQAAMKSAQELYLKHM